MFILVTHFALISSLVGQLFLVRSSHTLQFLIIQISIVDSVIRILYSQLSLILGFSISCFEVCEGAFGYASYILH